MVCILIVYAKLSITHTHSIQLWIVLKIDIVPAQTSSFFVNQDVMNGCMSQIEEVNYIFGDRGNGFMALKANERWRKNVPYTVD